MHISGARTVRKIVKLPKEVTIEEAQALLIHHLTGKVFTVGKFKKPAELSEEVVAYLNEVASPLPRSKAFLERYFVLNFSINEDSRRTILHVTHLREGVVIPKHIITKMRESVIYFTDEGTPVFWGQGLTHYLSLQGSV